MDEPFGLHLLGVPRPVEYLKFLKDPRAFLAGMGIEAPQRRAAIETVIENHDWIDG